MSSLMLRGQLNPKIPRFKVDVDTTNLLRSTMGSVIIGVKVNKELGNDFPNRKITNSPLIKPQKNYGQ